MRILLIDPPFHRFMGFFRVYYPQGLTSMAAVLQQEGHAVCVYDMELSPDAETLPWGDAMERCDRYVSAVADKGDSAWNELKAITESFQPDIVGVSVLSVKAPSALRVARICKELNRKIIVVVGGDHATVFPKRMLEDSNIDIVVSGEGEGTIVELAHHVQEEGMNGRLASIVGISYRHEGQIRNNPSRKLISDLDSLPFPAIESLVNSDSYRPVDFGMITTSRGCPYGCTFCGVHTIWTRKVRYRSVSNVLKEIELLMERYGTKYFSFRDASFTLKRNRIMQLCKNMIRRKFGVEWECTTRPDLVDEELLKLMKEAGCVTIRIGVESGDDAVLRSMNKEFDLSSVRQVARLLNKHKFYWSAYFLFGTPEETAESIECTLEFIKEIAPPFVTVARFAPIPGTKMCENLQNEGLISSDTDWGMETNQRLSSKYVTRMEDSEYKDLMLKVWDFVEENNRRKSMEMRRRDRRLK